MISKILDIFDFDVEGSCEYCELMQYLSLNWDSEVVRAQNEIENAIKSSANFKNLKKLRSLKKNIPFARKYINTNKDYNDAAIRVKQIQANDKDSRDTNGLIEEINNSKNEVPLGWKMFYGLGCYDKTNPIIIEHFLSLTFSPTIAVNHALRKSARFTSAGECIFPCMPTVLVVSIKTNRRALFGNESEFEMIIEPNVAIEVKRTICPPNGRFQFIECEL